MEMLSIYRGDTNNIIGFIRPDIQLQLKRNWQASAKCNVEKSDISKNVSGVDTFIWNMQYIIGVVLSIAISNIYITLYWYLFKFHAVGLETCLRRHNFFRPSGDNQWNLRNELESKLWTVRLLLLSLLAATLCGVIWLISDVIHFFGSLSLWHMAFGGNENKRTSH